VNIFWISQYLVHEHSFITEFTPFSFCLSKRHPKRLSGSLDYRRSAVDLGVGLVGANGEIGGKAELLRERLAERVEREVVVTLPPSN
jgi:hypothetical protein